MDLPPVIQGPLPWQWANLAHLEILNLSDATGQGAITGGIPHQWISISDSFFAQYGTTGSSNTADATLARSMVFNRINVDVNPLWNRYGPSLSQVKIIDVRGHPNFCRDWHRKFLFDILNITLKVNGLLADGANLNVSLYKEVNWQKIWLWTDDQGNTGPVQILSDGKCCWGNGDYGNVDAATRHSNIYGGDDPANPFANTSSWYGVDYGNVCQPDDQLGFHPPSPPSPPAPPPRPPPSTQTYPPTSPLPSRLVATIPKPPSPPPVPANVSFTQKFRPPISNFPPPPPPEPPLVPMWLEAPPPPIPPLPPLSGINFFVTLKNLDL